MLEITKKNAIYSENKKNFLGNSFTEHASIALVKRGESCYATSSFYMKIDLQFGDTDLYTFRNPTL